MNETLRGVVLRTVKYNDKNSVVRVYTDRRGLLSFLLPAGGGTAARRRRALFQPLSLVEMVADLRPGRELHRIGDARCLVPLQNLHVDPAKNAIALFLTELLSHVIVEQERNAPLFSFISGAVQVLDRQTEGVANFHICFLYNLGVFIGIQPDTSTYLPGRVFDMLAGVWVTSIPSHSHFVSGDEAEAVARLAHITFSNMRFYRFTRAQRNRLLSLTLDYFRLHNSSVGELRSLDVLSELFC